jgi:Crinkler effector protein N-terminal domain
MASPQHRGQRLTAKPQMRTATLLDAKWCVSGAFYGVNLNLCGGIIAFNHFIGTHRLPPLYCLTTMPDDDVRVLCCLFQGESTSIKVNVPVDAEIGDLKELVYEKGKKGTLSQVDAKDLVLLKASSSKAGEEL